MQRLFAFDVYGTLIDTHGLTTLLTDVVGGHAVAFSKHWRERQLEYSFRRALMGQYVPFSTCTAQALDQTAKSFSLHLDTTVRDNLLARYRQLPAYADVIPGLIKVQAAGHRCVAFSNGDSRSLSELLQHAGLSGYLEQIISVEPVLSFKPDPKVYQHLLNSVQLPPDKVVMVSSNPFDILGADAVGLATAWVARSVDAVFDPWGIEPTWQVANIEALTTCHETR